jgi:pimeloyl-ACP methyl ester carboxylesterase
MRIRSLLISSLAVGGLAACQAEKKEGAAMQPHVETATRTTAASQQAVTSKDGTRIAFDRVGQGPPLILVSGALSHRGLLEGNPLIAKLAEHFTLYTYDRRGRGESTDTRPYAVDREIEDLEALVAHAGQPVYVFGTSSGAALSMQAAAKLGPDKVRKLALYDAPYGQDRAAYATQKQGVAKAIATGKPGDAAALFLTGIGMPPEALAAMQRSPQWAEMAKMDFTLNYDFAILGDGSIPEDSLRAITVPTLVMTGENSLPFMQPAADRIATLAKAERKTLAGQDHQVKADAVVPVLVAFFAPASS